MKTEVQTNEVKKVECLTVEKVEKKQYTEARVYDARRMTDRGI